MLAERSQNGRLVQCGSSRHADLTLTCLFAIWSLLTPLASKSADFTKRQMEVLDGIVKVQTLWT